MKRRLNVKFLAILTAATALSLVTVYLLHEFFDSRNADGLIARATEAYEQGNMEDAVKFQRRYVYHRPDDLLELAKLSKYFRERYEGLDYHNARNFSEAYQTTKNAIRDIRDADNREQLHEAELELRRDMVAFAMKYGPLSEAVDNLKVLCSLDDVEDKIELQTKLARCQIGLGQESEGQSVLGEIIGFDPISQTFQVASTDPKSFDAYILLAMAYRQKLDNETAEKILEKLVEANKDSYDAYLKRCRYWQGIKSTEYENRALADIEEALRLAPDEVDVLITAADVFLRADRLDDAKRVLDHGREKHPDEVQFFRWLAAWADQSKDINQAIKYIEEGLALDEDNLDLAWFRANLTLASGNIEAVKGYLKDLRKEKKITTVLPDFLEATIKMADGDFLGASEQLEKIRPLVPAQLSTFRPAIDSRLAICFKNLKQFDRQIAVIERMIQGDRENLDYRWELVRAYFDANNIVKATEVRTELQDLMVRKNESTPVRYLKLDFDLAVAQELRRAKSERDWVAANSIMRRISQQGDDAVPLTVKRQLALQLLRAQGRDADVQRLENIVATGDDIHGQLTLIDKIYRESGYDAAIQKIDELERQAQDPSVQYLIRLARAQVISFARPGNASQLLDQIANDVDDFSDKQRAAFWRRMAVIQQQRGDLEAARSLYQRIVAINPRDVTLQIDLFDVAIAMKDDAGVERAISEIERLVGDSGAEYQACEAARILWRQDSVSQADLQRTEDLITRARRKRPNWVLLDRLEADRLARAGDVAGAIEVLDRIVREGSAGAADQILKRQLMRLLVSEKRNDEAQRLLDTIPPEQRTRMDEQIAQILSGKTPVITPQQPADFDYDSNSRNPQDHLDAAAKFIARQRFAEAEQALTRAIQTGPNRMEPWMAMVGFLVKSNRLNDAESVIRNAQLQLPEYLVPLTIGQCYELLGSADYREQARHQLERAHRANPHDLNALKALAAFHLRARQPEQAKAYLTQILATSEGSPENTRPTVNWARRELAVMMVSSPVARRQYRNYVQARDLIEKNANLEGTLERDDLVVYSQLASLRNDIDSRQHAIEKLESAKQSRELSSAELFELAKLYHATNQWELCREMVATILQKEPANASVRLNWIQWLLENRETDEAQRLLGEMDAASLPPAFDAARQQLNAELLARTGQLDAYRNELKKLLPDSRSADSANDILEFAQQAERIANDEDNDKLRAIAEQLYRRVEQLVPAGRLVLASYLARRGGKSNVEEAARLCQEASSSEPADRVARAMYVVVSENLDVCTPSSIYFRQLETMVKAIHDPSQRSMLLAGMDEMRGRIDEAMQTYQRFLDSSESDEFEKARAANNLAYLLALQDEGTKSGSLIEHSESVFGPIDEIIDTRAMVHMARNEHDKAKADLQKLITHGNESPVIYFHLALVQLRSGELPQARQSLERAKGLGLTAGKLKPIERQKLDQLSRQLDERISQR